MSVKKEEKAIKLEGLKVVGEKEKENKKEFVEKIYTSPVKIGDKEYVIKPLSMFEIKNLNIERKLLKDEDETARFDFTFHTMLIVIQKFNPCAQDMTVDDLEKAVDIIEFEEVQSAILQISGLTKYFKPGDSGK